MNVPWVYNYLSGSIVAASQMVFDETTTILGRVKGQGCVNDREEVRFFNSEAIIVLQTCF